MHSLAHCLGTIAQAEAEVLALFTLEFNFPVLAVFFLTSVLICLAAV
jgi:hypothetical protein